MVVVFNLGLGGEHVGCIVSFILGCLDCFVLSFVYSFTFGENFSVLGQVFGG